MGGEVRYIHLPSGQGGEFSVCPRCGSMVLDEERHDAFHDELRAALGGAAAGEAGE